MDLSSGKETSGAPHTGSHSPTAPTGWKPAPALLGVLGTAEKLLCGREYDRTVPSGEAVVRAVHETPDIQAYAFFHLAFGQGGQLAEVLVLLGDEVRGLPRPGPTGLGVGGMDLVADFDVLDAPAVGPSSLFARRDAAGG